MRSVLSVNAILAVLSLAGPAIAVLPAISDCVHAKSSALAELTSCGHQGSLTHCFGALPDYFTTPDLETCFRNAGCTPAEATIEALWALKRCEHVASNEGSSGNSNNNMADLRRRAPQAADVTPTPAATTPAAANPAGTTPPCSTTRTISTTFCPTQTTGADRGKTLSCFPTNVFKTSCAPGMLCGKTADICKVKNNKLDTAGVIVAIFFSTAIIVAVAAMCFFCVKDKRKHRAMRARADAAEAAAAAKEREMKRPDVAVRAVSVGSINMPLMQVYEEDPFRDQHRMG
ncbi:hypothetical protein ACHAQA_004348 [Verticillium albo-atrum]